MMEVLGTWMGPKPTVATVRGGPKLPQGDSQSEKGDTMGPQGDETSAVL